MLSIHYLAKALVIGLYIDWLRLRRNPKLSSCKTYIGVDRTNLGGLASGLKSCCETANIRYHRFKRAFPMRDRRRVPQQSLSEAKPATELTRLKDFLPYRLVVLADRISRSLSDLYESQFGLTRQEWRILAALADNGPISSIDVSSYSTLDPMAVSRASSTLEQKGYITREESPTDRRIKIFRSTRAGSALYRRIMPLAIDRERHLTEQLSADERACLEEVITKLLDRASTLSNVDYSQLKQKSRTNKGEQ